MTARICQRCGGNGNVLVTTMDGSWLVICPRCDGSGEEQIEDE
jgi:DnaJ-class molecular chaperone